MIDNVIEELARIVEQGTNLAADPDATVPQVRHWVEERQAIFAQVELTMAGLEDDERRAIGRLFAELMRLDGMILPGLERRLDQLGQELAGARRMQRALGTAQTPRSSVLQRLI